MRLKWKLILVDLEIVLILTQDRCTICAERSISLEIVLEACFGQKPFLMLAMVLLGDEAEVEAHFGPIGDGAKLDAR
jgi:hypothetical protein